VRNVIKYDINNRVEFKYDALLHAVSFYKYGEKNVTEIILSPNSINTRSNDFFSYKKYDLHKGLISRNVTPENEINIGINNKFLTYGKTEGKKYAKTQTINLKKDSMLTKNWFYSEEDEKPAMVVENYNGNKSLVFKVEKEKINNYIKILKDGKQ